MPTALQALDPSALEWSRPWALALAAALPLVLLLFARRLARPPRVATGALAIWRDLAGASERAAARRRVLPPLGAWLLAAALALGALALAGPRASEPAGPNDVHLLLDARPSVHLAWCPPAERAPFDPARPLAPSAHPTRLARAVERAVRALAERGVAFERRVWTRALAGGVETARGERPPEAWLAPPPVPRPAPSWSAWDRADVWWLTDRAPELAREQAGLVAAGGGAVPGPIAVAPVAPPDADDASDANDPNDTSDANDASGENDEKDEKDPSGESDPMGGERATLLVWTGEPDAPPLALPGALPPARVVVDSALPTPLRAIAVAWARARGHALVLRAGAELAESVGLDPSRVALVLRAPGEPSSDGERQGSEETVEVALARDGWSARGRVSPSGLAALRARVALGASPWLSARGPALDAAAELGAAASLDAAGTLDVAAGGNGAGRAHAIVARAPGRVDTALVELAEPAGEPAAFAVSWAELLDGALLAPAQVVPLAERGAAGPERTDLPALRSGPRPAERTFVPPLAFAAALLAALALALLRAPRSSARGR